MLLTNLNTSKEFSLLKIIYRCLFDSLLNIKHLNYLRSGFQLIPT